METSNIQHPTSNAEPITREQLVLMKKWIASGELRTLGAQVAMRLIAAAERAQLYESCEEIITTPGGKVWIKGEKHEAVCAQHAAENERLRAELDAIANMPEYDQDDVHRLRNIARKAIATARAAAGPGDTAAVQKNLSEPAPVGAQPKESHE